MTDTAIRAREAAEVLLDHHRQSLTEHEYRRALAAKRGAIHPAAAEAMLRLCARVCERAV